MIAFTKMQGAGNDFVVIDERGVPSGLQPAQLAWIANRRLGVGCDQVILLQHDGETDAFVRFLNGDGTESGACGNGSRCIASLLADETGRDAVSMRTQAGILAAQRLGPGRARVDLGAPRLDWQSVPLAEAQDTLHVALDGMDAACCSMGNPHATLFIDDADAIDIATVGPLLEWHGMFPHGANIGFAQVLSASALRLRVWERGAGLTLACGSGACAALVNAHRRGLVGRRATIEMPGGVLEVEWDAAGSVQLCGPTATVFTGTIPRAALPHASLS
ncbi:diaminopimelate epimerase [Lichenicoccus roseus]|uniref:Diaminopimelate epimerase n=1 Tax=Lichenicoccus roseus TaxID=2683649 RepID=A0A5R9JCR7_9PROT|nr:diaminopimelate epimerase [Lichenicoccus roseus]TLU73411.1 diaminopimelate epimerase [Lichenicoccus roseus]